MTFIVVPHGGNDRSRRSFEVSYRRLRVAALLTALSALIWAVTIGWALYVSGRAARVDGLESQIAALERENRQVDELAAALRRLETQYMEVRSLLDARSDTIQMIPSWASPEITAEPPPEMVPPAVSNGTLPTAWPLPVTGIIAQRHLGAMPGGHPGVDIAVAEGTPIHAAGAGLVDAAGYDGMYGNYVRILHPDGYSSVYAHAAALLVVEGDVVEEGEEIAISGVSGRSFTPHLHFEIWKNDAPIDPRTMVRQPADSSSVTPETADSSTISPSM